MLIGNVSFILDFEIRTHMFHSSHGGSFEQVWATFPLTSSSQQGQARESFFCVLWWRHLLVYPGT